MFNKKQIENSMPPETFNLFLNGFSDLEYIDRWTLVGGTALSIRYQHRLSEDLDFFIGKATLEEEKSRIKSMISGLRLKGFICVLTDSDSEQIDYEINGVKVTFHASGLKNLKDNCKSFGNIEVAGVNTIIVMKLDAIIRYRTKTRDFYDIYTVCNRSDISLFKMLDLYNNYTENYYTDELILKRFTNKALNKGDEGLDSMQTTGMSNFDDLKKWFKSKIEEESGEDTASIVDIDAHSNKVREYKDRCFGLERLSLAQKFATLDRDDMVIKCLELSTFKLSYNSLSGKNLLDYYLHQPEMCQKILKYTKEIPPELISKDPKYITGVRKKLLDLLKLENSIINCANKNCGEKRMEINANKFGVSLQEYISRVEEKINL